MRYYLMLIWGLLRLIKEKILNLNNLKIHGIKYHLGKNAKIWTHNKGICDLGVKTWLSDNTYFECNGGKIKLGYNNFFNTNCRVISLNNINIGDNCLFGPNVVIVDHNHRYKNRNILINKQGYDIKEVIIGSNVWIGANVTICAGVHICDNVVVGANSIVTKDIISEGLFVTNISKTNKGLIDK